MTLDYQNEIVTRWFERGREQGESTFDRFIYIWIALNAALSARFPQLAYRDRAKVEAFAGELAPLWTRLLVVDDELRAAALSLEERSPILKEPPGPREPFAEITVTYSDAGSVMEGIYTVRNNLFHGSKLFDVMRDHALVSTSTLILERVFITSGLYEMAKRPGGDLTQPLSLPDHDEGVEIAG